MTIRRYYYQGLNNKGERVRGDILAEDPRTQLRQQGIVVTRLSFAWLYRAPAIKKQDIILFSQQLAMLVEASLPLQQALSILAESQNRLDPLIARLKQGIARGEALFEVLQPEKAYFSDLFCHLIRAGEQSGRLATMLGKAAEHLEAKENLKKTMVQALRYPLIISLVACFVTFGMLSFVVPQFESLFSSLGCELPGLTQALLVIARLIRHYGLYGCLLFSALLLSLGYAQRHSVPFAEFLERRLLQLPLIGPMVRQAAIARFARTLALVFAAGMPLVEALQTVAKACGLRSYAKATEAIALQVASGQPLQLSMANTGLFPALVLSLVTLGEASGTLEAMLHHIAGIFEEANHSAIAGLNAVLEPLIMVFLGLVVGGLILALYWPIFQLGSAL